MFFKLIMFIVFFSFIDKTHIFIEQLGFAYIDIISLYLFTYSFLNIKS